VLEIKAHMLGEDFVWLVSLSLLYHEITIQQ
jgi:hypothetical protein